MAAFLVPLTRGVAAASLGAFLLYAGAAIRGADGDATGLLGWVVLGVALAVLGIWALSTLAANRLMTGIVLLLAGLAPVAAALGWMVRSSGDAAMEAILGVNLVAGLATTALAGYLLVRGGASGRERAARVARV